MGRRSNGKQKFFEQKREHQALTNWCNEVDGQLELTEETIDGRVTDGLTCRTPQDTLVSEYDGSGRAVTQIYSDQTEVTLDGGVDRFRAGRMLRIEGPNGYIGEIDQY